MIDGIADPCVFGFRIVFVIDLAMLIVNKIFKKRITADGMINVRLFFFTEMDAFCIAPTFKVKYPIIIPAMLIIADKCTFWIGRKGCFSCSRQSEENGSITIFTHIGRTVHGSNVAKWKEIVHDGEETFLDLSAIPASTNNSSSFF